MAITLGSFELPDGLYWSDELEWSPIEQQQTYSLSGALIVESAVRQTGRTITLSGQSSGGDYTAWVSREDLLALRTALNAPDTEFLLTLHDDSTFTVIARHDSTGPIQAAPLPAYKDLLPANPADDHWYALNSVRLIEVA